MGVEIHTTINLVNRAKAGDDSALNLLFTHYMDRILRMVRMRMGAKMRVRLDSMDVVQEVMERAIKAFDNFEVKHEAAFLHWIRKLVQNEIVNLAEFHNAGKRNPNQEAIKSDGNEKDCSVIGNLPAQSMWNPGRQLKLKEEVIELEAAMDELTEGQREVIIMKQYEGLTFKEMSEILKCEEDAARMKHVLAMDKLTDLMK